MIKLFNDLKDIYKICIKKHIHAYNSKTKTIPKILKEFTFKTVKT